MSKAQLVVFDWNGTIINDTDAAVGGFEKILKQLGDKRAASAKLHADHFQVPVKNMYISLGHKKLRPEDYVKLADAWEKEYWKLQPASKLHQGVKETLHLLNKQLKPKVILSNYTVKDIQKQLERFALEFDAILANDHYHEAHSVGKLHRLEAYLGKNGINPEQTIVIGDSTEEIQIARQINGTSIAITNGWTTPSRLKAEKPDHLIDSTDLPSLMKELINV